MEIILYSLFDISVHVTLELHSKLQPADPLDRINETQITREVQ